MSRAIDAIGGCVQLGQVDLVAGDQRDVVRDPDPVPVQGPDAARQDLVAAGDDRGRARVHGQDLFGAALAVLRGQRADQADRLVGHAAGGHCLRHAGDPLADGPQVQATGDERDPAVAEVQQVVDGGTHPRLVVVAHDARVELRVDVAVDHDHRHIDLVQHVERLLLALARQRQDHPVDATRLEEPDVRRIELGLVLRVHQQHRVARLAQHRLRARGDGRDERVGDVADHVADRKRRAATQALGQEIRLVLELVDRVEHALAHVGADVRVPRQDARNGGDRDVGEIRHLAHARPLAAGVGAPALSHPVPP